jgi:hypothetical protein
VAPAELTPCPDVRGGSFGLAVAFDPPVESEPSTAYFGGLRYERAFGKSSPDGVTLHPRYVYDPMLVELPRKAYVLKVWIGGKEFQSTPTDLVKGINLVPIKTGDVTRHVVIGSPSMGPKYKKENPGSQ